MGIARGAVDSLVEIANQRASTRSPVLLRIGIAGLTSRERDYRRHELDQFFSTLPTVAEGFLLKIWRSGPDAGA